MAEGKDLDTEGREGFNENLWSQGVGSRLWAVERVMRIEGVRIRECLKEATGLEELGVGI